MKNDYPYQLVAFLDEEPQENENIYYGDNGWYAQIALKRRFALSGINETQLIKKIKKLCDNIKILSINVSELYQPERMPIKVLKVEQTKELIELHAIILEQLSVDIISKYPKREGDNYLPHITAEYGGEIVIDIDKYKNKNYIIKTIWLVKDVGSENSTAIMKFNLK